MASGQSGRGELRVMEYLVILNFGSGTCQAGFPDVTAQIFRGDTQIAREAGSLPGIESLVQQYQLWQKLYRLLYGHPPDWRGLETLPDFEVELDDITNVSSAEFRELSGELEQQFNRWFDADGFRQIDRCMRMQLFQEAQLRVMIAAQDSQLLHLPWCRWSLLEDYSQAEIALSPSNYAQSAKLTLPKEPGVNILGVFGDADGLNLSRDRELLEALPDVKLEFLEQPRWADLSEALWSKRWDVLFFAGHSSSQEQGYIQLNEDERIGVGELKFALRKASEAGLQLAILNSCDGLGLAWELAELKIPQVIAMREPVADKVAQEFLKYFLRAFSGDQTLYLSVREAREKLLPMEAHYGCASWLPVIVQNPVEQPPTWRSLTQGDDATQVPLAESVDAEAVVASPMAATAVPTEPALAARMADGSTSVVSADAGLSEMLQEPLRANAAVTVDQSQPPTQGLPGDNRPGKQPSQRRNWGSSVLAALAITAAVFGLRWFGGLMPLELWALDQLMRSRPSEGPDPRLLLVTIDREDIEFQPSRDRGISLTDDSLEQLLEILSEAPVIGLDMYRDFSVKDPTSSLVQRLEATNLIGVCKVLDRTVNSSGVKPPPEIPTSNLGFSDFLPDGDGVLRRQIVSMDLVPGAACRTPYAFATQVVLNYFAQQNTDISFTSEGNLVLGDQTFPKLGSRMGGYQGIDAKGTQILLNYRALKGEETISQEISLRQVLEGNLDSELLRDRIVLIGGIDTINKDFWETPYGSSTFQQMSGVEVHAHVVSMMLSTVLDGRPLLWALSPGVEGLWILAWASLGGLAVVVCRGDLKSVIVFSGGCLTVLTAVSFAFLLRGGWVPLIPAAIALPLTATTALAFRQSLGSDP